MATLGRWMVPPGVNTWTAIQGLLADKGWYDGPIDGVPGDNTWKGVQRLAALGGYSGPIDGVPGANTYAGLETWLANGGSVTPPSNYVGVYGVDVAKYQQNLKFEVARSRGLQFSIAKCGGSNVLPRYVDGWYHNNVEKARAAGMVVGHYWLVGQNTPIDDANYFVSHHYDYRAGDILALDNESIDDGVIWNDSSVATFINRVKTLLGGATPFMYINSSDLQARSWPLTIATGAKLWIAHYTGIPGNPSIGSAYPSWEIHQYSSSGSIEGAAIDLNVAKTTAFAGLTPSPDGAMSQPSGAVPSDSSGGGGTYTPTVAEGIVIQRLAQRGGYTGPLDGDPGSNTWKGVQSYLSDNAYYQGPIDGVPGPNTYKGMQMLARQGSYGGPIDGILGPNTIAGIKQWLDQLPGSGGMTPAQQSTLQRVSRGSGYTGPVDGVIGAMGWTGVQRLVAGYGYNGAIDGVPGTMTWQGFQRIAQLGGYAGPIDGVLGTLTFGALDNLIR